MNKQVASRKLCLEYALSIKNPVFFFTTQVRILTATFSLFSSFTPRFLSQLPAEIVCVIDLVFGRGWKVQQRNPHLTMMRR